MKLITSSRYGRIDPSWVMFEVLNVVNEGEIGDITCLDGVSRIFPHRYGPPLGALMELADGPTVIVNADIRLAVMPSQLTQAARGGLAFAQRIETPSGRIHPWGFDLFAFDDTLKMALRNVRGWQDFQLGAPWWDYVFPMMAARAGVPLRRIAAPVAYHTSHTQNWRDDDYQLLGKRVAVLMGQRVPVQTLAAASRAAILSKADDVNPLMGDPTAELAWRYATEKPPLPVAVPVGPMRRLERRIRPVFKLVKGVFV